jgi:hypothetical protein
MSEVDERFESRFVGITAPVSEWRLVFEKGLYKNLEDVDPSTLHAVGVLLFEPTVDVNYTVLQFLLTIRESCEFSVMILDDLGGHVFCLFEGISVFVEVSSKVSGIFALIPKGASYEVLLPVLRRLSQVLHEGIPKGTS